MIKLSIIVPIYNVESYLRKCVDSLLAQDICDYEIILVDDGSTDSCPSICDEYSTLYTVHHTPTIKVLHQPNGGLSAARNSGIEVAKGEYIMFVDSDDYIEPNVLKGLLEQLERDNLDVLRYNYQNVNEHYEIFHPNKDPKRDVDYSDTVTNGETFLNERLGPGCYAWQFILRRDIIVGDPSSIHPFTPSPVNTLFTEGMYFEDTEWTPRMLLKAKRVASTSKVIYDYLWREGSISLPTDQQKREKVLRDKMALVKRFKEQSKLVKDPKWFTWMTSFMAMTILGMLAAMSSSDRKPFLQELKLLDIFPLSMKREKILSHKIKIILANISPTLYCSIMNKRI